MKDEIFYGIKNAMERGSSLEEAAQSFINSGYNPEEVKEAISMISSGASTIVQQQKAPAQPNAFPVDSNQSYVQPSQAAFQTASRPAQKGGSRGLIIFLVIVLLFLVGGIICFLLFEDKIISFLEGLLG